MIGYFYDTYALIEIYKGNNNYDKYKSGVSIKTSKLNIMEFVYFLLREGVNLPDILKLLDKCNFVLVDFQYIHIAEAMQFRLRNKKLELSYPDCVGYILSSNLGIKFLTGDSKFQGRENVEFVQ